MHTYRCPQLHGSLNRLDFSRKTYYNTSIFCLILACWNFATAANNTHLENSCNWNSFSTSSYNNKNSCEKSLLNSYDVFPELKPACETTILGDTINCDANGVTLTVAEGASFLWLHSGETSQSIFYNAPGTTNEVAAISIDEQGCQSLGSITVYNCISLVEGLDYLVPNGCTDFALTDLTGGNLAIGYALADGGPYDFNVDPATLVTPANGEKIYYQIFLDADQNLIPECGTCSTATGSFTLSTCKVEVCFELGDLLCENLSVATSPNNTVLHIPIMANTGADFIPKDFEFCLSFDTELAPTTMPLISNLFTNTDYNITNTEPGKVCFTFLQNIPLSQNDLFATMELYVNYEAFRYDMELDLNTVQVSNPCQQPCETCGEFIKLRYLETGLKKTNYWENLTNANGSIAFTLVATGSETLADFFIEIENTNGIRQTYTDLSFTHQFYDPANGIPDKEKYAYTIRAQAISGANYFIKGMIPKVIAGPGVDINPSIDIPMKPQIACNGSLPLYVIYHDKVGNTIITGQAALLGNPFPLSINLFNLYDNSIPEYERWGYEKEIFLQEIGRYEMSGTIENSEGDIFSISFDVIAECL